MNDFPAQVARFAADMIAVRNVLLSGTDRTITVKYVADTLGVAGCSSSRSWPTTCRQTGTMWR